MTTLFDGDLHSMMADGDGAGRTHQIRIHFADCGFGVVNDTYYNKHSILKKLTKPTTTPDDDDDEMSGMGLQAAELKFPHPETNEIIHVAVEPPSIWNTQ